MVKPMNSCCKICKPEVAGILPGTFDEYNAEFRSQLDEFKEGNLLFEIMERKVWSTPQPILPDLKILPG